MIKFGPFDVRKFQTDQRAKLRKKEKSPTNLFKY